jgi:hypothetical protein
MVLGIPAHGRDVSEPYSFIVGDMSSSWRRFFLLLDTYLGVIGSSSFDLVVPKPCSSTIDARVKLETVSAMPYVAWVGEVDPSEVGRTKFVLFVFLLTTNSLSKPI